MTNGLISSFQSLFGFCKTALAGEALERFSSYGFQNYTFPILGTYFVLCGKGEAMKMHFITSFITINKKTRALSLQVFVFWSFSFSGLHFWESVFDCTIYHYYREIKTGTGYFQQETRTTS